MAWFEPEKMVVYRLARRHSRSVRMLIEAAHTQGFADLVSQLRRSTASIPANLLEAAHQITALLITTIRNLEAQVAGEQGKKCRAAAGRRCEPQLLKSELKLASEFVAVRIGIRR